MSDTETVEAEMTAAEALEVFDGFISSNAVPPKYRPGLKKVHAMLTAAAESEK